MARGIRVVGCEETRVGCSRGIFMENRFACNVTVFQVNLTEVEGARAGPDRTGPGSLLPAWPGAFYLRGQGPFTCVAKEPATCVVKEPSTCVARSRRSEDEDLKKKL